MVHYRTSSIIKGLLVREFLITVLGVILPFYMLYLPMLAMLGC